MVCLRVQHDVAHTRPTPRRRPSEASVFLAALCAFRVVGRKVCCFMA